MGTLDWGPCCPGPAAQPQHRWRPRWDSVLGKSSSFKEKKTGSRVHFKQPTNLCSSQFRGVCLLGTRKHLPVGSHLQRPNVRGEPVRGTQQVGLSGRLLRFCMSRALAAHGDQPLRARKRSRAIEDRQGAGAESPRIPPRGKSSTQIQSPRFRAWADRQADFPIRCCHLPAPLTGRGLRGSAERIVRGVRVGTHVGAAQGRAAPLHRHPPSKVLFQAGVFW